MGQEDNPSQDSEEDDPELPDLDDPDLYSSLDPAITPDIARSLIRNLLTIPYCPQAPTKAQAQFLLDLGQEALYGGAAGGGKSSALLMAALQFIEVPGYNAIIFRRTFQDLNLPGALMDRARSWLHGSGAKWNDENHAWTMPEGGSLTFGYLEHENDKLRYQGAEFQYVGMDELTQLSETQYRYLFSRLRRGTKPPLSKVPVRMRAACVDEGDVLTESGWRPIDEVAEGELVYGVLPDGEMVLRPVLATYRYWTDSPLTRVRKKNLFMSMTTDHRVVFQRFGSARYDITPWDAHVGRCISVARAPESYTASGKVDNELGWDSDTYLAFLGLFLAEGCTNSTPRDGNYKVVVTQCSPAGQAEVAALFDRLPYRWSLSRNGDFQITNKRVWEHFRRFGRSVDKHVPREVLANADMAQLRLLLRWLVLGDGHIRGDSITYVTCSPQLADDVAEIGVKLGYKVQTNHLVLPSPAHNDRYTVYLAPGTLTKVDKNEERNDVTLEPFSGWVYCIKVAETENFVLRQQGKVWLSGNTNPGGPGHGWVHRRFILPWDKWREGEWRKPPRNFHPATLDDNPHLDRETYTDFLMQLDPITRGQLLRGDWSIRPEGRMFKRAWFPIVYERPAVGTLVRRWDLAGTDPNPENPDPDWTVGLLLHRTRDGLYTVCDVRRIRASSREVDALVLQTARLDGVEVPISMGQDPGAAGKAVVAHYRRLLDGFKYSAALETGNKIVRAGPVASQAEGRNVQVLHGEWNADFLEEIELFPDGEHDDQVDALSGAHTYLAKHGQLYAPAVPVGLHQANPWKVA